MKIGLYSDIAHQEIVCGQTLIAEKGYSNTPKNIRQCRQDVISMSKDGNQNMAGLCAIPNFYSLSECRDLLFHVQEHRFTLPEIEVFLQTRKLKFLGFEFGNQYAPSKFKTIHQNKQELTSISLWHEFELMNPDTFLGMYQFWCKKQQVREPTGIAVSHFNAVGGSHQGFRHFASGSVKKFCFPNVC